MALTRYMSLLALFSFEALAVNLPDDLGERAQIIPVSNKGDSCIHSRLYLGDRVAAGHAAVGLGVEAIVNCAPRDVAKAEGLKMYFECDLADAPVVIEGGAQFDDASTYFQESAAFIEDALAPQPLGVSPLCWWGFQKRNYCDSLFNPIRKNDFETSL